MACESYSRYPKRSPHPRPTQSQHRGWKFYTVTRRDRATSLCRDIACYVSAGGGNKASLLSAGRTKHRNRLPLVPAIDPKIAFIDGYDRMMRMKFTHSNQAYIGKIRTKVGIAARQVS